MSHIRGGICWISPPSPPFSLSICIVQLFVLQRTSTGLKWKCSINPHCWFLQCFIGRPASLLPIFSVFISPVFLGQMVVVGGRRKGWKEKNCLIIFRAKGWRVWRVLNSSRVLTWAGLLVICWWENYSSDILQVEENRRACSSNTKAVIKGTLSRLADLR